MTTNCSHGNPLSECQQCVDEIPAFLKRDCEHGQLRRACEHCDASATIADLTATVERLREVLQRCATQSLPHEMSADARPHADFEGAYHIMIQLARDALGKD